MTIELDRLKVQRLVWRWAYAEREACNPNTTPLYGMPKVKTQKQRSAERLVAVATRNMLLDIFGIDPLYTLAIYLGYEDGLAPNEEIVKYINQRHAAVLLTDLLIDKASIVNA